MLIKPINTVVCAEDFKKMLDWYINTFDMEPIYFKGMENSYVDLKSGDKILIGMSAYNSEDEPLYNPRRNATYMQISCSHIFTMFDRVKNTGGEVMFGPAKDTGYWYGGIKDPEGNTIWIFTPDEDLKEEIPADFK